MDLSNVEYKDGKPCVIYFYKRRDGRICKDIHYGEIKHCLECGSECFVFNECIEKNRGFYCSYKCANKLKNNPMWKGGVIQTSKGYSMVMSPNHPFKGRKGYVLEHRLVMENRIGRYLKSNEVVHHINKNIIDNRIENLMLLNNAGAHSNFDKTNKINPKYVVFDGGKNG